MSWTDRAACENEQIREFIRNAYMLSRQRMQAGASVAAESTGSAADSEGGHSDAMSDACYQAKCETNHLREAM